MTTTNTPAQKKEGLHNKEKSYFWKGIVIGADIVIMVITLTLILKEMIV